LPKKINKLKIGELSLIFNINTKKIKPLKSTDIRNFILGTGVTSSATNAKPNSYNNNGNNCNSITDDNDIHKYNKNNKEDHDFVNTNGNNDDNSAILTTIVKDSLTGHHIDNNRQYIHKDDANGNNDYEDKSSCVRHCASTTSIPIRPCTSTASIPIRPCTSTASIPVRLCASTTSIPVRPCASTTSIPVRPCAGTASIPVRISDCNKQQRTDYNKQREENDHLNEANKVKDDILDINEKFTCLSKDKEGASSDDNILNNDNINNNEGNNEILSHRISITEDVYNKLNLDRKQLNCDHSDNINNNESNNEINDDATDNRYKNNHDHNDHYEDSNKVETYTQESVRFDYDEGNVCIFERVNIYINSYMYIYISISLYMYLYICVNIHIHKYTCVHTLINMYTHIY
jgi:hypothetical protein